MVFVLLLVSSIFVIAKENNDQIDTVNEGVFGKILSFLKELFNPQEPVTTKTVKDGSGDGPTDSSTANTPGSEGITKPNDDQVTIDQGSDNKPTNTFKKSCKPEDDFIVASDFSKEEVKDDVNKMLRDLSVTKSTSNIFSEDIKDSDIDIKVSDGSYLSLNKTNFPILEKSNITSVDYYVNIEGYTLKITPKITYKDNSKETLREVILTQGGSSTKDISVTTKDGPQSEVTIKLNVNEITAQSSSSSDGNSVRVEVDGDHVTLDGLNIAERHGNFVGSNLMVTHSLGSKTAGSTASVPNQYSSTGGAIQKDLGDGLKWYYVKSISSDGQSGTLSLEDLDGDETILNWAQTSQSSNVIFGETEFGDINVYDWSNSNPDGISIGTSTSNVEYVIGTLDDLSFGIDTDWSTYTNLVFEGGSVVELGVEGSSIVLSAPPSGTPLANGVGFSQSVGNLVVLDQDYNSIVSVTNVGISVVEKIIEEGYIVTNDKEKIVQEVLSGKPVFVAGWDADDTLAACPDFISFLSSGEEGTTGSSHYNPEKMKSVIEGDLSECPLTEEESDPCYVLGGLTTVPGISIGQEDKFLECVENMCVLVPASEAKGPSSSARVDCFGIREGNPCRDRVAACLGKKCAYTNRRFVDQTQVVMCGGNVGQECCQGPIEGECKPGYRNHPNPYEAETDRNFGSWTCDYKIYEWVYCYPYNEELCTYSGTEIEKRILKFTGALDGINFLNCGSEALKRHTFQTPYGIAGVKG